MIQISNFLGKWLLLCHSKGKCGTKQLFVCLPPPTIRAWRHRKDILTKGSVNESVNQLMTKMFVEQLAQDLPGYDNNLKMLPYYN